MDKKKRVRTYLRIALSLLFTLSMLLPQSAIATVPVHPLQQSDPVMQCVQSLLFLFQGQFTEAKPQLEAAVTALQASPNPNRNALGMCALFLGIVHHSTQDWVEALAAYTIALPAFQENDNPQMIWAAQFGIGTVYLAQGRFSDAYTTLQQTLPLTGKAINTDEKACADPEASGGVVEQPWTTESLKPLARAVNLNNVGLAIAVPLSQQQKTGATYEKAQHCFTAALQILQQLGNQSANPDEMLSTLLLNLTLGGGSSEDVLSDLFTNVLVSTVVPELAKSFEPILLSNLGQVYAFAGDYKQAQAQLEQALQQIKTSQAQNNTDELQALLPMLDMLLSLPGLDLDPTLQETIRSLPELMNSLSRVSNVINLNGEAVVLNNLALVYNAQGQHAEAQATFEDALTIYEDKLANYPGAVTAHVNLGWLAQQAGNSSAALDHYEAAINLLAAVRPVAEGDVAQLRGGNVQTLNLVGNEGILSQQADVYALATNLYLQQDKPAEALQTLEQGRARLFFDMMSAGNPHLFDTDAALLSAVREAFDLRTQANISLTQLRAVGGANRGVISRAERELESAKDQYDTQLAALQAAKPSLLSLAPGVANTIDLPVLQSQVFSDTTLIVYYIAEGILVTPTQQLATAWVINANDITAVPLTIAGTKVRGSVTFLRNSIEHQIPAFDVAGQLYTDLFAPLQPYIQHNNLIIVPYGSLYYLPFAALWDAKTERYLIEDYAITYAPSVGTLPLIQSNRNLNEERLFAMANNVDGTLPNVVSEVITITQQFSATLWLNEEATKTRFVAEAGKFDLIHLAAHGHYDNLDPLASYIELAGEHGNLRVSEIFSVTLSEANLVVLSACKTALGDQSMGDEIMGLTRAFLYVGTPSIITTLWSIEDKASEALMTTFYQHLRTERSFAAALRAAQMEILRKDKWQDPFYWAAFTLHGDYLGIGERKAVYNTGLISVATPTATPTPTPVAQLEVLISTLNVRSGPGTAYPVIGTLQAGNQVEITGQDRANTWWEICCVDGQRGWVINNQNYIHIAGEIDLVPQSQ